MNQPKNGKLFSFEMKMSLGELISCEGANGMNETMDREFEKQFSNFSGVLTNVSYKAIKLEKSGAVIVIKVSGIVDEY